MTEPVEREEYSAKQIATRINVDAKVLRKFFRSEASTVEPVGQGGRYIFDAADLPKIREEFENWNSNKKPRAAAGPAKKKGRSAPAAAEVIEHEEEILEFDDDPSEEDLDDLDELDDLAEFDDGFFEEDNDEEEKD